MEACTRCGRYHTDAEKYCGRYLSCTEVKEYWSDVRRRHKEKSGHYAQLRIKNDGTVICMKCGEELTDIL